MAKGAYKDVREDSWPAGLYRRVDSYRYRRTSKGRKFFEVLGQIGLDAAIRRATKYNLALEEGRDPRKSFRVEQVKVTTFAEEWLQIKAGTLKEKSIRRYSAVVENFLSFLEREKQALILVSQVDHRIANRYIADRRTAPIMPNGSSVITENAKQGAQKKTLHFEKEVLSQMFREAVDQDLLKKNPFSKVYAPRPKPEEVAAKHHPLMEPEIKRLLSAARQLDAERHNADNARFRDIVLLMVNTGLRDDEARFLEWSDIDWKRKIISIGHKEVVEIRVVRVPSTSIALLEKLVKDRRSDSPLFQNEDQLKKLEKRLPIRSRRDLAELQVGDVDLQEEKVTLKKEFSWTPKASIGTVPLDSTAYQLLSRLHKEATGNFVFAHHDGGHCRLKLLDKLKRAQEIAEIPGRLRIHDLRHTFAVRLRTRGVAIETIMGLMRHADIKETLIYAPYDLSEGIKAVSVLDDADAVI